MAAYYPPEGNEALLGIFGTPALLWRVLHFAVYIELPQYFWTQRHMQEEPWYEVQVTILACTRAPQYQGWKAQSEGRTPWEGAQVAAFEILSTLCQQHGDSLTNSVAGSIPQVDLATIV